MAKLSYKRAAKHLASCERILVDLEADDPRREQWERQRDFYKRHLVGRCLRCGRELHDPESVALKLGPECRRAS